MQHNADMDKPDEHVLWALVNIGSMTGAPLLMPVAVMKKWSEHLYKCGFRHHQDKQTLFYRPPGEDASLWDGIAGEWIEAETPGESPVSVGPDELDAILAGMDEKLKAELRARLNGGA